MWGNILTHIAVHHTLAVAACGHPDTTADDDITVSRQLGLINRLLCVVMCVFARQKLAKASYTVPR
jgi:hypothetical protein